jgi:hypothetical protein
MTAIDEKELQKHGTRIARRNPEMTAIQMLSLSFQSHLPTSAKGK